MSNYSDCKAHHCFIGNLLSYSVSANLQPPSDVRNSQQSLYSNSQLYLSTSSSFPISYYFPPTSSQCSCLFKPSYQAVTANISIRALIVDLEDWFPCSQKLTIRSCLDSNDTVFCSRSVSSSETSYSQLELNPSISFKSNSSFGRLLLDIRSKIISIALLLTRNWFLWIFVCC